MQIAFDYLITDMFDTRRPLNEYGLTSIPGWISNYIHYKVWNEITY